jgi:hypothetical protein
MQPRDLYENIIPVKDILIKCVLPIDFKVKQNVRYIKHKSKFWKFLWWVIFIL